MPSERPHYRPALNKYSLRKSFSASSQHSCTRARSATKFREHSSLLNNRVVAWQLPIDRPSHCHLDRYQPERFRGVTSTTGCLPSTKNRRTRSEFLRRSTPEPSPACARPTVPLPASAAVLC